MSVVYKLLILSFAVTLSAAYLLIEGYEVTIFLILYVTHIILSTYIKDTEVESDDPFDLLRYRPAIMR